GRAGCSLAVLVEVLLHLGGLRVRVDAHALLREARALIDGNRRALRKPEEKRDENRALHHPLRRFLPTSTIPMPSANTPAKPIGQRPRSGVGGVDGSRMAVAPSERMSLIILPSSLSDDMSQLPSVTPP